MGCTTKQHGLRPRGVTLIELLIVLTIMLLVTAAAIPMVVPATQNRRMKEASRLVSSYIAGARSRAIETGRPVGVMIERFNGQNFAMSLSYVEVPLPYAGDTESSRVVVQNVAPKSSAAIVNFAPPASDRGWQNVVRYGDMVRLNYQGPLYMLSATRRFPLDDSGIAKDVRMGEAIASPPSILNPWYLLTPATISEPFTDGNGNQTYDYGETYTDANGNNQYDTGELFVDSNGNGSRDPSPDMLNDANMNGRYDPGETYTDGNANGMYDPGEMSTDWDWNQQGAMPPAPPNGNYDGETFNDRNSNGVKDTNGAWVPYRFSDNNPRTVPFQIFRQPVRSSAAPLQLPEGIVIDLAYSGVGLNGTFGAAAAPQPPDTPNPNTTPSLASYYRPVTWNPVIVFSPNGAVQTITVTGGNVRPSGPIFLLLGRRELMMDVSQSQYDENYTEPATMNPKNEHLQAFYISIGPQTGHVATSEAAYNPTEPFQDSNNNKVFDGSDTLMNDLNGNGVRDPLPSTARANALQAQSAGGP